MSSLAELPKVIGFFSYSRDDDEGSKGTLSELRDAIQRELSAQLGRSNRNFRLFQDQQAIAPGKLWEAEITKAIQQAVFFIPIVTPRTLSSSHCKLEFELFLARERALRRDDLVFPILYITVQTPEDEARRSVDPVLSIIGKRQYVDWRAFRHESPASPAFAPTIDRFCSKIVEALNEPWLPQEERLLDPELDATLRNEKERIHLNTETNKSIEEKPSSQLKQVSVSEGRSIWTLPMKWPRVLAIVAAIVMAVTVPTALHQTGVAPLSPLLDDHPVAQAADQRLERPKPENPAVAAVASAQASTQTVHIDGMDATILGAQLTSEGGASFVVVRYEIKTGPDFVRHDPASFISLLSHEQEIKSVWASASATYLPSHSSAEYTVKFLSPSELGQQIKLRIGDGRREVDLPIRLTE